VDGGWTGDTGPALRPAIRLPTLDAHELSPREGQEDRVPLLGKDSGRTAVFVSRA
jgi:hypothetical protein